MISHQLRQFDTDAVEMPPTGFRQKRELTLLQIQCFDTVFGTPAEESVPMSLRMTKKPTTKTVTAKGGLTR